MSEKFKNLKDNTIEGTNNVRDEICIEGNTKEHILKVTAKGKAVWAVALGATCVVITAIIKFDNTKLESNSLNT